MHRRQFSMGVAFGLGAVLVGCASESTPANNAAKKVSLDADSDFAVSELYAKVAGAKELVEKAKGVLIFPKVVSAGLVLGGSYGEGTLRVAGQTSGYYSMGSGAVGVILGAASKAAFVLFMTEDALDKFVASNGWTIGVDASAAALSTGADGRIDTVSARAAVIAFVVSNGGLMANLSVEGTKVQRLLI
jgi:lipid-binding SYLF domain-containing protein